MESVNGGTWNIVSICKCGNPVRAAGQRYCTSCHAEYMRKWRKTHRLEGEALKKSNARSYANTYLRRGLLKKEPCIECGSPDSEMHHEDYNKPLEVIWLCRKHHLKRHREER